MKCNLYLVGAPKCGTTALASRLAQHSAIYLPKIKEPHYFCTDFPGYRRVKNTKDYESILGLPIASSTTYCMDASVWYLYSKNAAQEIRKYNSKSRVLVIVRDPVTMLPSLHNQLVYSGREDIVDFESAFLASTDRAEGRRIPSSCLEPSHLVYTKICNYAQQINRYVKEFGFDNVHVISFEDFRANSKMVVDCIFEDIGVPRFDTCEPADKNPARKHYYPKLSHFLMRPPGVLGVIKKSLKSSRFVRRSVPMRSIYSSLSKRAERTSISPSLSEKIRSNYTVDRCELDRLYPGVTRRWGSINV